MCERRHNVYTCAGVKMEKPVCVCVCVCVGEREREREGGVDEREKERKDERTRERNWSDLVSFCVRVSVK